MRSNTIFVVIFFFTLFAAVLVLLAAGYVPPGTVLKTDLPPADLDGHAEQVEVQVDDGALVSEPAEPTVSQVTPLPDGPSLLESHCAQCHVVQQLEQIQKPRSAWEESVAQMEGMGVHLSDVEKVVLLDYLAVADER